MADPHYASVTLLALQDNGADAATTFVDQSSSPKTLTAAGNYQWDTAQKPTGLSSSGLGDGSGDWLTVAHDASLTPLINQDFTIEWFMFCSALPAANNTACGIRKHNASTGYSPWAVNVSTAGALTVFMTNAAGSWAIVNGTGIGSVTTGAWHHIALSRTGTAIRGYLNGVGVALATSAAALYPHTDNATIGGIPVGAIWAGWTAGVRLTMGVGRYPVDFTPPSLPFSTSVTDPVVVTGQTPAGNPKTQRRFYVVKVEGEDKVFNSVDDLVYFLETYSVKAEKSMAKKAVRDAKRVLSLGKVAAKPNPPQVHISSEVTEIKEYVDEVQKKIDRLYWRALAEALARDAEELEDIKFIASIS